MTATITPPNGNPGTVPPWIRDPILPLPDPLGDDTPMILPVPDEWAHERLALSRVAEAEFGR